MSITKANSTPIFNRNAGIREVIDVCAYYLNNKKKQQQTHNKPTNMHGVFCVFVVLKCQNARNIYILRIHKRRNIIIKKNYIYV